MAFAIRLNLYVRTVGLASFPALDSPNRQAHEKNILVCQISLGSDADPRNTHRACGVYWHGGDVRGDCFDDHDGFAACCYSAAALCCSGAYGDRRNSAIFVERNCDGGYFA